MKQAKRSTISKSDGELIVEEALHHFLYEIKQNVANIIGFNDLLRDATGLADKHRQSLAALAISGNHISQIINHIMETIADESKQAADLGKLLNRLDLQRIARISALFGPRPFPVPRREVDHNSGRTFETGVVQFADAFQAALLAHVGDVLGLSKLLKEEASGTLTDTEVGYVDYIIDSAEVLIRILPKGAFGTVLHTFRRTASNTEIGEQTNIDEISDSSRYDSLTPSFEERKEGNVSDVRKSISGDEGIKLFLRDRGVADEHMGEAIAEAERLAIRAKIRSVPKWAERPNGMRYLTAPGYLRSLYAFLFDKQGRLQHEDLVREHDSELIRLIQQYVSQRSRRGAKDLGDAEGLVFGRKDARGRPRKTKGKRKLAFPGHE